MDEPAPISPAPPTVRHCAVCGAGASYGFGPPGFPLQHAEAWYCAQHRHEGERVWSARYGSRRNV